MARQLFRKAALEKLASPEQLDVMMEVTSPKAWLGLLAMAVGLAAVVTWGFVGTISTKVDGLGMLLRGEALLPITPGTAGRVSEMFVRPGDNVRQGDVIARVAQEELEIRIDNLRSEIEQLEIQARAQGRSTESVIDQLYRQRRDLEAKLQQEQRAFEQGLITRSQVLTTQQAIANIDQQIASNRDTQTGRSNVVDSKKRELLELQSRLATNTAIVTPYSGRVIEVIADLGSVVAPGARVVTMESFDSDITAVFYVPAQDGKRVKPGMPVQISPATVKVEEYGFILGEVVSVGDYPESPESLQRTLRNQNTVNALTGQGAPFEVVARLIQDPATPSGFAWSSSQGPPQQVFSGTPCEAKVKVDERRPVSYVLPIFKKALGLGE
jgi:HlyD family secretion protein